LNRLTELFYDGRGNTEPDPIGAFGKCWVFKGTAAFQEQIDSWNRDRRIVQQQLGGDYQSMEKWDL
jgi:hypothetical protein